MTAGRMMTAFGALTLGLAMAGAVPAMAQNNASSNGGNATKSTGTAAMGQAGGTGQANTSANSSGGNSQTSAAPTMTGQTNNGGTSSSANQSSMHMNNRTGMAHTTTHRTRTTASRSRGRGVSNANPDAQNSDIARLNEQSLQAAQQGHNFTPSGGSM